MSTNFPNGISSFGVPVLGGSILTTGNIFFVDSGASNAVDTPANGSADMPFATMDYCVGRMTANNGDHMIVMPGHAEVVSAAGGLNLDVAGINVVGIGSGANMPTVTIGVAASADVDINAANVTVTGINFVANLADVLVMIDVNATDFTLHTSRFTQTGVALNALVCVQDATSLASNRMSLIGNHVIMNDAAGTHFVNFSGTGDGHIVTHNVLLGDWGTMAIGGAGVVTLATIMHNRISNAATDTNSCINFAATATGIVMGNWCCGGAAQAAGITATAMAVAENYYGVVSEDLSAILEPIAT